MRRRLVCLLLIVVLTLCSAFPVFAEGATASASVTAEKPAVPEGARKDERVNTPATGYGSVKGLNGSQHVNLALAEAAKSFLQKKADQVNLMMHADTSHLYIAKPVSGEVVYKGDNMVVDIKINDCYSYYYTAPVLAIYDANNNAVYSTVLERVPVTSDFTTYSGYLGNLDTSSLAAGNYSFFVFAAPCDSSGTLNSDWASYDMVYAGVGFVVKAKSNTDMSNATVTLSATKKSYTGSALKPGVTVKMGSKTLIKGTDYKVTYSNNTNVGVATVKVTGLGKYSGSKSKHFTIIPMKTAITKINSYSKGEISLGWKRISSQVNGYQIMLSKSSTFSTYKKVNIKKSTITNTDIANLTAKRKYYVKIRTYKVVNDVKYYSLWSDVKAYTTK